MSIAATETYTKSNFLSDTKISPALKPRFSALLRSTKPNILPDYDTLHELFTRLCCF
jgi:hypothetical protein